MAIRSTLGENNMTLQQAAFVAQCLRRWGYEAIVRRDFRRKCFEVFVFSNGYGQAIFSYEQAVKFRDYVACYCS